VPKKNKNGGRAQAPLYRRPAPKPKSLGQNLQNPPNITHSAHSVPSVKNPKTVGRAGGRPQGPRAETPQSEFHNPHFLAPSHFTLREDGSIGAPNSDSARPKTPPQPADLEIGAPAPPRLVFSSESPFIRLYHGNCLELLDAIAAKYPEGRFDAIFADPPYFLSNGGITCHAGESHFRRPQLDLTA
jgi:hypothetical protein